MKGSSKQLLLRSLQAGGLLTLMVAPLGALLLVDRPLRLGMLDALRNWNARLLLVLLCIGYGITRHFFIRAIRLR